MATLLSIWANSIINLNILRAIQGIGIAASSVIARAIIVELYQNKSSQIFSIVFPFAACSPAIAPPIGGLLIQYFNKWQSIYIVLLIISIILTIYSYIYLPPSLNTNKNGNTSFTSILTNYAKLCQSKLFLSNASIFIAAYAAWFIYILETPFIFSQIHLSPLRIGLTYIPLSIGFFVGNFVSKNLLNNHSSQRVISYGATLFFLSSLLFLVMPFFHLSIITIVTPMVLLTFSNGLLIANAVSQALLSCKYSIAYASSLIGFLQISFSAMITFIVAKLPGTHYWIMSGTIMVLAISIIFGFILSLNKTSNTP